MIIWSGIGIILPVLLLLFYWLTMLAFEDKDEGGYLHHAIAFFAAGFFWWLTMKRQESTSKKIKEGHNEELKKQLAKAETNPIYNIETAHLFFIPVLYWHYIFYVFGAACLAAFFSQ